MTEQTNQDVDILTQLGVKDISKQNANKFYKFAIYGKFGTGKTTFLTKDNNTLVLDINEDGTTVTEDGAVVASSKISVISSLLIFTAGS